MYYCYNFYLNYNMNENEINDKREKELGLLRSLNIKNRRKKISRRTIQGSRTKCLLGIELICSGLFMDLWEIILQFIEYIHLEILKYRFILNYVLIILRI